jgi:hypothetical protein
MVIDRLIDGSVDGWMDRSIPFCLVRVSCMAIDPVLFAAQEIDLWPFVVA